MSLLLLLLLRRFRSRIAAVRGDGKGEVTSGRRSPDKVGDVTDEEVATCDVATSSLAGGAFSRILLRIASFLSNSLELMMMSQSHTVTQSPYKCSIRTHFYCDAVADGKPLMPPRKTSQMNNCADSTTASETYTDGLAMDCSVLSVPVGCCVESANHTLHMHTARWLTFLFIFTVFPHSLSFCLSLFPSLGFISTQEALRRKHSR